MTSTRVGVAVMAAAFFVPSMAWGQQSGRQYNSYDRGPRETETVNKTVAFPDKGLLVLKNFSGDVRISAASGREVVVKAVRRGTREQLDHIKLEVETSGAMVRIDANVADQAWRDRNRSYNNRNNDGDVVETELDIQVPAHAKLEVDVFSSDIDVRGVSGDQRLKTFSGEITADLTPAGATPSVDAETFSGDIRVRVVDGVKSGIRFDSFSGGLDTDMPIALKSSSGRWGSGNRGSIATEGTADTTMRFHTFSGNVRITK